MKSLRLVVLVMVLVFIPGVVYSVERTGDEKFLDQKYWLPKDARVEFHYDAAGNFEGFEVFFQTGNVDLFKEWRIGAKPFPFILEATLIVFDMGEVWDVAHDDNDGNVTRGEYWDFSAINQCIDQPRAYIDSHFLDFIEGNDHFGIGILNPQYLDSDRWYRFFVKMKSTSEKDPRTLTATLRFRLNIDVWKCGKYSYNPGDDFDIGDGWWLVYPNGMVCALCEDPKNLVEDALCPSCLVPTEQEIGETYSFALKSFERKDGSEYQFISDFIPNVRMEGSQFKPH